MLLTRYWSSGVRVRKVWQRFRNIHFIMCGIAGIIPSHQTDPQDLREPLLRMQQAIAHRGPDGDGHWCDPSGRAAIAHTRLAILDLSDAGAQPMSTPDGRYHITFNGEIYNYLELRKTLEKDGVSFRTHTDTEVLLHLFALRGPTMLPMLRGMYSFAIWDSQERSCVLARDPLGIKPLFYTVQRGVLSFASELRAVLEGPGIQVRIDPEALLGYFERGSVAEPATLVANVHCLEAGHYVAWKQGRLTKHRHWQIHFGDCEQSNDNPTEIARNALLESVNAHFVSDVPVGLFLSGGIDSTAILALAKVLGHNNLRTFSIGVHDRSIDESGIARRTANHFGTDHTECFLDAESISSIFEDFLTKMDQPSIDGLNTFSVSQLAHKHQMKAVLSGLGGDELFGGYRSFQAVPSLSQTSQTLSHLPLLGRLAGWTLERMAPSNRLRRIGSLLQRPPGIGSAFRCFRSLFSSREARILASHYLHCSPSDVPESNPPTIRSRDPLDAVSECEISQYMRNQLLRDTDVMSMANAVELRVPFVDRRLFESIAAIPAHIRLRSGKQFLQTAVPEIPPWVLEGQKRGFVFPFQRWLATDWREAMNRSSEKLPLARPTWYQSWSVFILDQWLERHPLE